MSTKPDEARTLGAPSPTPGPAPGAAELQRGAAPTLATPGTKAPNVSTSGPRDPASPTRVVKKRPVRAAQEVRP